MFGTEDLTTLLNRVINIVEEIESLDAMVSSLDYEISVASKEDRYNLEEQFSRFRNQSNDLVNDLKDEGITIDYDGPIIRLSRNGKPWIERTAQGNWIP
jgi:hypothetical protein